MANQEVEAEARRAQAIADFLKEQDLTTKLDAALKFVATRNPSSILVFWEEDSGYGAITVPYSNALAYGLANKAYETLVIAVDNEFVESQIGDEDE